MNRVLTLLTDFGLDDGYVGAMKGVLLTRAPGVMLVDVSHQLPPGDVPAASFVLAQAARWFPPDTVHLAVVDPGVGSERLAVAVRVAGQRYVAPDNGLLSGVLEGGTVEEAHRIEELGSVDVSPVFHGRDLFAPAAAHLARGGAAAELGPALDPARLMRLPRSIPGREDDDWVATVIHVDRFGNLITNLPLAPDTCAGRARVGRHTVAFATTYSQVATGELVAVRGSQGLLEIAVRDGRASERLGMARGDVIKWRALERR